MPFLNVQLDTFGLSDADVRTALAEHSLPLNLQAADLSDFGFEFYAPSAPPTPAWDQHLVELAPVDDVQQWVLVPNGLTEPPAPPRPELPKSTVIARVMDIGKIAEVHAFLLGSAPFFAQWTAPDWPNVFCDDSGLLYVLNLVGCTEAEILQITAYP